MVYGDKIRERSDQAEMSFILLGCIRNRACKTGFAMRRAQIFWRSELLERTL
jgi:hypothetical protein